jgi:hypothetical protein
VEEFEGQDEALATCDVLLVAPPCGRDVVRALWPRLRSLKWVRVCVPVESPVGGVGAARLLCSS